MLDEEFDWKIMHTSYSGTQLKRDIRLMSDGISIVMETHRTKMTSWTCSSKSSLPKLISDKHLDGQDKIVTIGDREIA